MLVRPVMKRLFFPWKTNEKKARFARAPHYDQILTGWGEKKASFLLVEFPSALVFGMPFGLSSYTMLVLWRGFFFLGKPRKKRLASLAGLIITCSLRHPILSLSILNVILFGAIYHRLLVKPHPASPQPLPADVVSTQRTKYKNHLTPMGWGG